MGATPTSLADFCGNSDLVTTTYGVGNFTEGAAFFAATALVVTGARCRWDDAAATTLKLSLWDKDSGVRLATANVATAGVGVYAVSFGGITLTPFKIYIVSRYDTSTTNHGGYTLVSNYGVSTFTQMIFLGGDEWVIAPYIYVAGDAMPTTSSGGALLSGVEPTF